MVASTQENQVNNSILPVIDGYQIVEQIGVGGNATVYRGVRSGVEQSPVALKILHQRAQGKEGGERFVQECESQRRLSGAPGVATLLDHGILPDGTLWLVTELFDVSYAVRLRCLGTIGIDEVVDVGYQIATTLAYAHGLNIVHGDIKPGNLFISNSGYVALGDFGSCVDLDQTLSPQNGLSLSYVAPESLRLGIVSPLTDLYALGATLYHLISGSSPLPDSLRTSSKVPLGAIAKFLESDEIKPLSLSDELSNLEQLIEQLMSRSAVERPSSAKEVARRFKSMQRVAPPLIHNMAEHPTHAFAITGAFEPIHDRADSGEDPTRTPPAKTSPGRWVRRLGIVGIAFVLPGIWLLMSAENNPLLHTVAGVESDTTSDQSVICSSAAFLCEAFDDGLDRWELEEDEAVAQMVVEPSDWQGNALAWRPRAAGVRGSSYAYRVVAKPAESDAIRIRTRIKALQRTEEYFWMTLLQFNSSDGHTWSLNFQQISEGRVAFDMFYYDAGGPNDDSVATHIPFRFNQWLCAEMIYDPESSSALQLYINGDYAGQLSQPPMGMNSTSYEFAVGSTDAQSPATAPTVLFDDVAIERGNSPVC